MSVQQMHSERLETATPWNKGSAVPWELSSVSPVSLRAEAAWDITRGSRNVTIAIIDESFDASWLATQAACDVVTVDKTAPRSGSEKTPSHGTLLAGLIVGNRWGYHGVAPDCRLLAIRLPSVCSEGDEVAAFKLAVLENAAVVCCPWGCTWRDSFDRGPLLQHVSPVLQHVSRFGHDGRGALICFASSNSGLELDAYTRHPAVAPVFGVGSCQEKPLERRSNSVRLFAPASDFQRQIGGLVPLPPGSSGPTALASGVAALVFSVNPNLTRRQVCTILRLTQSQDTRVIDAFAAVRMAQTTRPNRSRASQRPISQWPQVGASSILRARERRFNGGEHCYLGQIAAHALGVLWRGSGSDPVSALFGPSLAPFTRSGVTPTFSAHIRSLLTAFFDPQHGPVVAARPLPYGTLPYGMLLGLAADLVGSPLALKAELSQRESAIVGCLDIFHREVLSFFRQEFDIQLALVGLRSTSDHVHYAELAQRNYSHFAGDNLLFYLAHHLVAVELANRSAAATSVAAARQHFVSALMSEAFAGHFLTDMFSAAHARVPRWAMLQIFQREQNLSSFVSRLLHQNEGRLGVFFTNSIGQVWYGYGDAQLMAGSDVSELAPALTPWTNLRDPLAFAAYLDDSPSMQLRHERLAASVVFASLLDVLRHCAEGVTIEDSAQGRDQDNKGLLGYVLDRAPFALSAARTSTNTLEALRDRFGGPIVDGMGTLARLNDRNSLFSTYRGIVNDLDLLGPVVMVLGGRPYPTIEDFELFFAQRHLNPLTFQTWSALQIPHLLTNLRIDNGSPVLEDVPRLLRSSGSSNSTEALREFPNTGIGPYEPPAVGLPQNWRMVVPRALTSALTEGDGVWGIGQ